MDQSIFRAYDIRGVYPTELNEVDAYTIARAIFEYAKPTKIAVGRDARLAAPVVHQAVCKAFVDFGCVVTDLGVVSSDMAVFAAGTYDFDLTVMITASHNPKEWIGMKLMKRGGAPIGGAGEIETIRQLVADSNNRLTYQSHPEPSTRHPERAERVEGSNREIPRQARDDIPTMEILPQWVQHVLSFVDAAAMRPMKIVVDAGNGVVGPILRELAKSLPVEIVELYFEPDGNFPNHLPSPIEPENTADLCQKVIEVGADVGMAFDGDADRIFLVDEQGQRVSGSEMTALLLEEILSQDAKRIVLYNAICGWNVRDVIAKYQATAYRTRVGHGFIKKDMQTYGAYFAGEHSGHYFFADNFNADAGLIPAVMVLALLSRHNRPISELLAEYRKYVSIPETNFRVHDPMAMIEKLARKFQDDDTDRLDGLTIRTETWWSNMRPSQTEPLLRLNIEATTPEILERVTKELTDLITELDRVSAELR